MPVFILLLALICFAAPADAQRRVEVADSGISLELPATPAFTPATGFDGLIAAEIGATVHVALLDRPYDDALDALAQAGGAGGPLQIVNRRDTTFGTWQGELIQARQIEGNLTYVKFIATFGDRSFTAITVTTFPAINERAYADVFRRMTQSVRAMENYLSGDVESVDFSLQPVDGLVLRESEKLLRRYGLGTPIEGQVASAPGEPEFTVEAVPYTGPQPTNLGAYAQLLLERNPTTIEEEVQLLEDHRIDGLPAVLIIGKGRHVDDPRRIRRLYQAAIFAGEGYYVLRGKVDLPFSRDWLEGFVTMGESFRRSRDRAS